MSPAIRSLIDMPIEVAHRVLAPRLVCLVGSISNTTTKDWNICPASNIMSVSNEPQKVAIAIYKEWTTCRNIRLTREFSINMPDRQLVDEVWLAAHRYNRLDYAGVNKMKLLKVTPLASERIAVPKIAECFAALECVVDMDADLGDHHLFVGRVVNAQIRRDLQTDEWRLPLGSVSPILQNSGSDLVVPGEEIRIDMDGYQQELRDRISQSQDVR